ncbi:MAG TPA: hypothetical protein DGD08_18330 [Gemmatimonas aurantiaca]|uniref:Uncharacterized protein n=2 Tax=Gemmatimonas aurantiaca TaxID=173480 RepID=A0A3D4VEL4_9BACT|nr:hypothetical protein [Gemmatimonas aurantiaca]
MAHLQSQWRALTKDPLQLAGVVLLLGIVAARSSQVLNTTASSKSTAPPVLSLVAQLFVVVMLLRSAFGRSSWVEARAGERLWLASAPVSLGTLLLYRTVATAPMTVLSAVLLTLTLGATSGPEFAVHLWGAFSVLMLFRSVELVELLELRAKHSSNSGQQQVARSIVVLVRTISVCGAVGLLAEIGSRLVPRWPVGGVASVVEYATWLVTPISVVARAIYDGTGPSLVGSVAAVSVSAIIIALTLQDSSPWRFREDRGEPLMRRAHRDGYATQQAANAVYRLSSMLGLHGRSLVWKNAVGFRHTQSIQPLLLAAIGGPALLALCALPVLAHLSSFVLGLVASWGMLLLLGGPLFIRSDIRLSLPKVHLLKGLPIDMYHQVIGESVCTVLALTLVQGLLIGLTYTVWRVLEPATPMPSSVVIGGIPIVLLAFNTANVGIHGVFGIFMPSLTKVGPWRAESRAEASKVYITMIVACLVGGVLILIGSSSLLLPMLRNGQIAPVWRELTAMTYFILSLGAVGLAAMKLTAWQIDRRDLRGW